MSLLVLCASHAPAQGELIERTLALVGGQPITLTDVRLALALGLVEPSGPGDPIPSATSRLIDRVLVLREVQRYAPPEPADAAIEARVAATVARFPTSAAFQRALEAGGFSEARLRAWARDDLRIAAYLVQRFTAAGVATEDDVAAYYAKHRDEYEKTGTTYEQAAPSIRERLANERRAELVTDWIADLRRRTPVVELVKN